MKLSDYDYELPKEFIAQYPSEKRDQSRLLVLDKNSGAIQHRHFYEIGEFLRPGDCLVINNSKVFAARLFGKRKGTGGKAEIFLLRRIRNHTWEALVNPGRKLQSGSIVEFDDRFHCKIGERTAVGGRIIELVAEGDVDVLIEKYGHIPLPPYISRNDEPLDRERYQTVFAQEKGAVAAPTAGFHFTPELLSELKRKGVVVAEITLHPSLGTFRPVTVQNPIEHKMEPEYFKLSREAADKINEAIKRGSKVFAVGTTAVRTLEKAAVLNEQDNQYLVSPMEGQTDLYIYPPYEYKIVNALITNFHLPKSTLLFLVSAFAGRENVLNAYEVAKKEGYRFYSYGDAMLIV